MTESCVFVCLWLCGCVLTLSDQYARFLELKASSCEDISPPVEVDLMWYAHKHTHIHAFMHHYNQCWVARYPTR